MKIDTLAMIEQDLRTDGRHPPSDGAWRLAWHVAEQDDSEAAIEAICRACDWAVATFERVLTGELEPADVQRATIERLTAGAVRDADWNRGGPNGWRDRPSRRPDPWHDDHRPWRQ